MNFFGLLTAVLLAFNWSTDATAAIAATPTIKDIIPTRTGPSAAIAAYAGYNYEMTATFVAQAPYPTPIISILPSSAQSDPVQDSNVDTGFGLEKLFWSVAQGLHDGMLKTVGYYLTSTPFSEKVSKRMEDHLESQKIARIPMKLDEIAFPIIDTLGLTLVECPMKLSAGITSSVTDLFSSAKVAPPKPMLTAVSFDTRLTATVTSVPWDELIMIVVLSLSISREIVKVSWVRFLMLLASKLVTILVPIFAIKCLLPLTCRKSYKLHPTLSSWYASAHHMFHAMKPKVYWNSNTIKADEHEYFTQSLVLMTKKVVYDWKYPGFVKTCTTFTNFSVKFLKALFRENIDIAGFIKANKTKKVKKADFLSRKEFSELRRCLEKVEAPFADGSAVNLLM